ncbi:MAG: Phosphoribosylamine--glycine ligase [Firmicutes bacterium ADurb.Bin080]|jgi:phosphoribosylamine---glycine ligase|nr:MAG: Phosphoribosylamine--glycine ligase [Firmicutes bacterium ADurb.Bin080]
MKVLVIGSGGREHAICMKLKDSPLVSDLFACPGNAGIEGLAKLTDIKPMEFEKIYDFSRKEGIDLVFVAPDDPLAGGLVNYLEERGINAFGPRAEAAIIEGSKAFSKAFMKRHNIPTADYEEFTDVNKAIEYIKMRNKYPAVIKADGLALGKGVIIAEDEKDAISALHEMMECKVFGDAGSKVIIEEYLTGREVTVLAFTDGETIYPMPSSQDHKKAFDYDKGPNTGGMGAFSPAIGYTKGAERETLEKIIFPTIKGLKEEGRKFKGVIYFGLMVTDKGVKVIEYNARFGDPETEAILPLLKTDLMEIILAIMNDNLASINIEWESKIGFCVIVASGTYPGKVIKGFPISIGDLDKRITLFHCGTAKKDGKLVTNGGRVLCLSTVSNSMDEARELVYSEINKISFEGARYRTDIGKK